MFTSWFESMASYAIDSPPVLSASYGLRTGDLLVHNGHETKRVQVWLCQRTEPVVTWEPIAVGSRRQLPRTDTERVLAMTGNGQPS